MSGSILFTADWQWTTANQEQVETTVDQILGICKDHNVKAVVHCGDMKDPLNPLDGRVVLSAMNVGQRFRDRRIPFLINLGNHDKFSITPGTESWLPLFRWVGAHVFENPGTLAIDGTGMTLHFLPFRPAHEAAQEAAKLAKMTNPRKSILVFHQSLRHAKANELHEYREDDALHYKELEPDAYLFCIGGHFHGQQNVAKNVWFCGSPFPSEWGECNQAKGFLLVNSDGKIKQIPSVIPGWHDPSWPNYKPPKDWKGTSVRIHVPVDKGVTDVGAAIAQAASQAKTKYPGARVVAVPLQLDKEAPELDIVGFRPADDTKTIKEWCRGAMPESLRGQDEQMTEYLLHQLGKVSGLVRSTQGCNFESIHAENVLSFREVTFDYTRGLTVVTGVNKDWDDRSNGSGKTSLLQLLAIALFGQTLKGQKADGWRNRKAEERSKCYVELTGKLPDGKKFHIFRGRSPKRVSVTVDGKDVSVGDSRETQRAIEQITGLTWEILCTALFVDQRDLNKLLIGTDGDRKAVLSQFLNLERFQKAQLLVKDSRTKVDTEREDNLRSIRTLEADIERQRGFIATLEQRRGSDIGKLENRLREATTDRDEAHRKGDAAYKDYKTEERKCRTSDDAYREAEGKERDARRDLKAAQERFAKAQDLVGGNCPVCRRKVKPEDLREHINELRQTVRDLEDTLPHLEQATKKAKQQYDGDNRTMLGLKIKYERFDSEFKTHKRAAEEVATEIEQERRKGDGDVSKYKRELKKLEGDLAAVTKAKTALDREYDFVAMAFKAFGKDGIPAYIAAGLCPRLNRSAAYYSSVFADGEIRARFRLDGDDIIVDVDNDHGGAEVKDQSNGESRMASLIVSFAMREAMTPCNILITDEPGEGLDERNARQFSAGLLTLKDRYRTILVTTHNPYVLAELSDQRILTVTKRDGYSELQKQERRDGKGSGDRDVSTRSEQADTGPARGNNKADRSARRSARR